MALYESVAVKSDNLLAGGEVTALTKNISITTGTAILRGTLVDEDGAPVTKGGIAAYIVARDIAATDVVATVYSRGYFNREAAIVAEGDTVADHEDELKSSQILFTSIH